MISIAELLQQQGREAAETRRTRGALWGTFVQQAGQIPARAIADQQAEQDHARAIAAEAQQSKVRDLQIQQGQGEIAANTAGVEKQAKLRALWNVPGVFNAQTGRVNLDLAGQAAQQLGAGDLLPALAEVDQHGHAAQLDALLKQSTIDKNTADVENLRNPKPKPAEPFTLNPGDVRFDGAGRQIATGGPKPETRALNAQLLDALKNGDVKGAAVIRQAMREGAESTHITVNTGQGGPTDVADAVAGMMDGTLPPQLPGRASKEYLALLGEAKRRGFDLAAAATDWTATQKHIATLNGAQQLRLNQAVNQLPGLLDTVEALAGQWKGGRFPVLNKANLALAKGGAYGDAVSSVASQLDAQIADVTADLGNVYMGGSSPTDHALSLASKSLSGDWSEKVLKDMIALARQNVKTRQNSIRNTGVAGASDNNPYAPRPGAEGRTRVMGPNGETGSVPTGTALPTGWKAVP